jgi:tetratricopeptide (TPR) repeat protein
LRANLHQQWNLIHFPALVAFRPALHAWAKLEDDCGRTEAARQLYTSALALRPGCLHTLSSLGRLERKAGDLAAAERSLQEALAKDPHHVASVHELALVREAQVCVAAASAAAGVASRLFHAAVHASWQHPNLVCLAKTPPDRACCLLLLLLLLQGRGAESLHLQSQAKRLNSSLKASAREVAALKLPATVAAAVAGSDQPSA